MQVSMRKTLGSPTGKKSANFVQLSVFEIYLTTFMCNTYPREGGVNFGKQWTTCDRAATLGLRCSPVLFKLKPNYLEPVLTGMSVLDLPLLTTLPPTHFEERERNCKKTFLFCNKDRGYKNIQNCFN